MRTTDNSSYLTRSLSARLYTHCVISHSSQCSTTGVPKDGVCAMLSVVLYHMADAI